MVNTTTFRQETIISEDHIKHLQNFTSTLSDINKILGYNNSYREIAAVALDQQMYPELEILHNSKVTGADATDKFQNRREYKKIELGPSYKKPFERTYKKDGSLNKKLKGNAGFQPNKLSFMLSRFRNEYTQLAFMANNTLTISFFFAENAMPSISYVIKTPHNLQKIVAYFNNSLYNAPYGTNKWSHNNASIPMTWILSQLDSSNIDVIVMIENKHYKITVPDHNTNYIGKDLTLCGFSM